MTPYQPRWVKGRATTQGERDAETRYVAIRELLRESIAVTGLPVERVLDLGAYGGYFSFRLAEDFGCRVVAVDDHPELKLGLDANQNSLVDGIHRRLTPEDVEQLGDFDAVLALSVLHHVPAWKPMLDALLRVTTQYLFIETPSAQESLPKAISPLQQVWSEVENLEGRTIASVAGYDGRYVRDLKVVSM